MLFWYLYIYLSGGNNYFKKKVDKEVKILKEKEFFKNVCVEFMDNKFIFFCVFDLFIVDDFYQTIQLDDGYFFILCVRYYYGF